MKCQFRVFSSKFEVLLKISPYSIYNDQVIIRNKPTLKYLYLTCPRPALDRIPTLTLKILLTSQMCRNIWSISVAAFAGHQRRQKQMECSENRITKTHSKPTFPYEYKTTNNPNSAQNPFPIFRNWKWTNTAWQQNTPNLINLP
jgi:hypothetical protein